jgi:hypothetical protein
MDYATALRQGMPGTPSGPARIEAGGFSYRPNESWDSRLKNSVMRDFPKRVVDEFGLQPFLDLGPHAMTLARGLQEMAFPPASADSSAGPLQDLFAQKAELSRRRAAAASARDAEGRTGKGPKWQSANDEVSRIDAQISGLDQIIAEEQKKNSPEFALKMEEERRQAKERAAKEELDKPFQERHPMITAALNIGAIPATLALSRFGLGKIANKGESLMAEVLKARKAGDIPGMTEASAKLAQWQKWAMPKQAAAVAVPATLPADVRTMGSVIDKYSLPPDSKAQQAASKELGDPLQYAKDLLPALMQGLTYSGIGAKLAKPAPLGDARAMTSLYGRKDQSTLAATLKQGDLASAEVRGARSALRDGTPVGGGKPPTRLEPESTPAIAASPTSTSPAPQVEFPTAPGSPTRLPGTSLQGTAGSGSTGASGPSLSSELSKGRVVGGSNPDHNWNSKAGRWQDVDGRFLPGPPPKD